MTDMREAPSPESLLHSSSRACDALTAFMVEWEEFEASEDESYLSNEDKANLMQASVCLEALRDDLSMWGD